MGEMIGTIAHQWKQPLNNISLSIGMLDEYEGDEDVLEDVKSDIFGQVTFMSQTINDFRNFFKPDRNMELFQPCEVIHKINDMFACNFQKQGIRIHVYEHKHFCSYGPQNEFLQAVLNIFNNAKDVMEERGVKEGVIECIIIHEQEKGIIRIRDNGGGIPEELLPEQLFNTYISTKGDEGTGIGLHISKTIIEQKLQGKLLARNIEAGAEFIIELPIAQSLDH